MISVQPPDAAAWSHRGLRVGFETLFVHRHGDGFLLEGCTTAVEDAIPWTVRYEIGVDGRWTTRSAHVATRTSAGAWSVTLEADGQGRWQVDGAPAPLLDGCLDVDLEASAMTNTLPIHRLPLDVGGERPVAAAYVRTASPDVQRLEQSYERLADGPGASRFRYRAPAFDFSCELVVDPAGFVLDYPGLARRVL